MAITEDGVACKWRWQMYTHFVVHLEALPPLEASTTSSATATAQATPSPRPGQRGDSPATGTEEMRVLHRLWRGMTSSALLVAAAALAALGASSGADATVVATCLAAADSDRRVNYDFCVPKLSKHRDSPGADTWGLAKVAANVGVNCAGNAINDMQALLAAKGAAPPPPDAKTSGALRRCEKLYYDMELAFAGTYDEINARNYTAGKQMAADAESLVRQCDGGFAEAGVLPPEPVARRVCHPDRDHLHGHHEPHQSVK